ncbi:hypothetical protein F8S13_10150 [Chloroflexia bacterium SDU3-3]|nr:hypothetical protein F8S13_10150 [Chloroflexia bacterium SDU3-3]
MIVLSAFMFLMGLSKNQYCELPDLDCSWRADLQYKLDNNQLSGRDFIFTYGPVSQYIFSIGQAITPTGSVADSMPYIYVGPYIVAILALACVLVLSPWINWQGSLLTLTLFIILDVILNMRALVSIVALVIFSSAINGSNRYIKLKSIIAGLVCFLAQTITFDSGIFCAAACTALYAIHLFIYYKENGLSQIKAHIIRILMPYLLFIGTFIALNIGIDIFYVATSNNYSFFDYQFLNLQLVQAYNYTMGSSWEPDNLFTLVIFSIPVYCVFVLLSIFSGLDKEKRYAYIGLGIMSLLQLKGALVRSDNGHVMIALSPLILLFALLIVENNKQHLRIIGSLLLILLIGAWPNSAGITTLRLVAELPQNPAALIKHIRDIRSYRLPVDTVVPSELQAKIDRDSHILNFPNENIMAIALGHQNIAPVLQPYSAHNSLLQSMYVHQASAFKDTTNIIYGIDFGMPDQVDNITRTPQIFEYIFNNFERVDDSLYKKNYFLLKPRKQPIAFPTKAISSATEDSNNGRITINLKEPATCTLVKVRMSVRYPLTSSLGRPTPLSIKLRLKGGDILERRIPAIDVGKEFATYVYVGNAADFPSMFAHNGKNADAQIFDSIQFSTTSLGFMSVPPSSFQVGGIDCIDLSDGKTSVNQSLSNTTAKPIVADNPVQQDFIATQDNLQGVSIRLATYNRTNSGTVTFTLSENLDATGKQSVITSQTVKASAIVDNAYFLLSFDKQPSKGKRYTISISATATASNKAITAWMQSGNPYPSGKLLQGGQEVDGDLTFKLKY